MFEQIASVAASEKLHERLVIVLGVIAVILGVIRQAL